MSFNLKGKDQAQLVPSSAKSWLPSVLANPGKCLRSPTEQESGRRDRWPKAEFYLDQITKLTASWAEGEIG